MLADYLCSLGILSLPIWPTVSASQATVSTISATVSAYGLSLQSRQTLSALWNFILAGSHPSIRAALSLYLSAFPYLSKGRNLKKKLVKSALADICTKHEYAVHIYRIKKLYISIFLPQEITKKYFINALSKFYNVLCFVLEFCGFYNERYSFYEDFRILHRNSNVATFRQSGFSILQLLVNKYYFT